MRGHSCTHTLLFNNTTKNITLQIVPYSLYLHHSEELEKSSQACRADNEVLRISVFSNSKSSERTYAHWIYNFLFLAHCCIYWPQHSSVFLLLHWPAVSLLESSSLLYSGNNCLLISMSHTFPLQVCFHLCFLALLPTVVHINDTCSTVRVSDWGPFLSSHRASYILVTQVLRNTVQGEVK